MLKYELSQKIYLPCILFLSKLLKKVLLKIKRVDQIKGGDTGTEIIRMTLKGEPRMIDEHRHRAPSAQIRVDEGSYPPASATHQVRGRWEPWTIDPSQKKTKNSKYEGKGESYYDHCASNPEYNQLRQEKEGLQEGCFQENNWNVCVHLMWLTLLEIVFRGYYW